MRGPTDLFETDCQGPRTPSGQTLEHFNLDHRHRSTVDAVMKTIAQLGFCVGIDST